MKRSKAVSWINNYLTSESIHEISAEQILRLVETIGMIPPPVEVLYTRDLGTTISEVGLEKIYEWEEE